MYKILLKIPYHQTYSSFFVIEKRIIREINISPFARFSLKGNHFILKADGPAQLGNEEISLRFSVNAVFEIPSVLEFGNVRLPHTASRALSLDNVGNVPLAVTRAVFSDRRFSLASASALPWLLEPGARSSSLEILFKPSMLGLHNATLVLWSHEMEHTAVALSGYGAESQIVISAALVNRVLAFFNSLDNPEEIVVRIKDDPTFLRSGRATRGVHLALAREILKYRNNQPDKHFVSLAHLETVRGIGPDTLHDILYSFLDTE